MFDRLCPGKLKWQPVDFCIFLMLTYQTCSGILTQKSFGLSNIPLFAVMKIAFYKVNYIFWITINTFSCFPAKGSHLITLPSWIYGQAWHGLLHFFMPHKILLSWGLFWGKTLDLTIKSLIFLCLLYAVIGGWENTSCRCGSILTMDLQCLFKMEDMLGSLGSNVNANATRAWGGFLAA